MLKKLSFKATRSSADDKWPPTLESCLDCRVAAASLPRSPRRTFEIIVCAQYVLGATRASMLSSVRCFGQMAVSNGKSIFTKRSLPLLFFRFKKAKQKESNKKPVRQPWQTRVALYEAHFYVLSRHFADKTLHVSLGALVLKSRAKQLGLMVLASLASAESTARCWLCCSYASCVHRQSLSVKQAQVRATPLSSVRVLKGVRALASRCQRLCYCRAPGQP